MLDGLSSHEKRNSLRISRREEAIKAAWQFAQPGDLVFIAGKGHETYQEVHGVKHHFDDREVVKSLIDKTI